MRRLQAAIGAVEKRAVGRDVVQPIGAVVPPYFAVLSGYQPAGVGESPVEILIATDVDAALALDRYAERPAIRQAGLVFYRERQCHGRLFLQRSCVRQIR